MPTYGCIEVFSGQGEEFETYMERMQIYLDANDLEEVALDFLLTIQI